MWDSLLIITPVSLLTHEFNVRGILHGQVNLAAVNQIYVLWLQKSKDSFKMYVTDQLKDVQTS